MRCVKIVILFFFIFIVYNLNAQNNKEQLANSNLIDTSVKVKADTTIVTKNTTAKDTITKKKHDPAKATRRSAIIPGWGQAYNHQYWKIPIVYGVLAIPASLFVYNNKWYKKTKVAYEIVVNQETDRYNEIDSKLQPLLNDPQSLQYYRNSFRQGRDYSILFFLAAWGLNIVDATVFGHLKDFDVSDDLSMHLQPDYNPVTKQANIGLAFNIKKQNKKLLTSF